MTGSDRCRSDPSGKGRLDRRPLLSMQPSRQSCLGDVEPTCGVRSDAEAIVQKYRVAVGEFGPHSRTPKGHEHFEPAP
jgi:hypothetical protein